MSSGEAAGKVLQAEGRNENSQMSGSPPGPGSLGTGGGRAIGCASRMCLQEVQGGAGGAGCCRAQEGHDKSCEVFSFLLKATGSYGGLLMGYEWIF